MNRDQIVDVIEKALGSKTCVPVVGAGASMDAGGPSWQEYLRSLARDLPQHFMDEVDRTGVDNTELAEYLLFQRQVHQLPPPADLHGRSNGEVHRILAQWDCPLYLTTNFDRRLQDALAQAKRNPLVLGNDQLFQLNLNALPSEPVVIKLCHSAYLDSGRMASARDHFAQLSQYSNPAFETLLTVLRTRTLVFVGCSMSDPLLLRAFDHAFSSDLRYGPHVALLGENTSATKIHSLSSRYCATATFPIASKPREFPKFLKTFATRGEDPKRLLLLSPRKPAKLRQVLNEANALSRGNKLHLEIDVLTTEEQATAVRIVTANPIGQLKIRVIPAKDLRPQSVAAALISAQSADWDGFICPDEMLMNAAAELAESMPRTRLFHAKALVLMVRAKDSFRSFLSEAFRADSILRPTPYRTRSISMDSVDYDGLEKMVQELRLQCCQEESNDSTEIVIKPTNQSGSLGVRLLSADPKESARLIRDTIEDVKLRLGVKSNASNTFELLAEKFHPGEEFSVESRWQSGTGVETLAVHWKPGIDNSKPVFLERIYTTLDPRVDPYNALVEANASLINALSETVPEGFVDGVFHAEYRVSEDLAQVFPLEIGLRPGGGMTSKMVELSTGQGLNAFAIAAAVRSPLIRSDRSRRKVVASGEIFAPSPGILCPIRVQNADETFSTVRKNDVQSLKKLLQDRVDALTSDEKREILSRLLSDDRHKAVSASVGREFEGRDLSAKNVQVDHVEMYVDPGDAIENVESEYVLGIAVSASGSLSGLQAMAEVTCAMEACLKAIECRTVLEHEDR